MMLSMKEVQKIKNDWNHPYMCKNELWDERVNNLFDTIEALQQENERLKTAITGSKVIVDVARGELGKAKQENEQLQAQTATLREALKKARETLKQLHYMPEMGKEIAFSWPDFDTVNETLDAIDNALGGNQNAMLSVQR